MAEEPRITRFKIDWGGNQSRATQEEQQAAAPDQNTEVDFSAAQFEEKKATNYWFSLKIDGSFTHRQKKSLRLCKYEYLLLIIICR